ncbi:uncharacterized protein PgNI_04034 [Pyricularia grisea]|uniref:Uncharacterized protein n=1 Tax=Pyricularia grisea TaxID=148305 RepID=A0A6P8BF43_PYRGI|nr:uncharacterized protein PgNI_04034 [Pyricularia grisea]TLD14405.1 hypothetical protein PgNI_04034 [Pyricularia grisea]
MSVTPRGTDRQSEKLAQPKVVPISLQALQAFPADAIVENALCAIERSHPRCLLAVRHNMLAVLQRRPTINPQPIVSQRQRSTSWPGCISPRPSKWNRRSATGAARFIVVPPWSNFLHLQLSFCLSSRPVGTSDLYWSPPLSAVERGGFETISIQV